MILKQATPYVRDFFMTSSTDHVSGVTGITPSVTISKGGASFFVPFNPPAELGNGWYQIQISTVDSAGGNIDYSFHITGTGADPTDFVDQLKQQIFNDLTIINNSLAIRSAIKAATALPLEFPMTANGMLATGLVVTGKRSLDGGAFANCVNPINEVSNGIYNTTVSQADTNGKTIALRFTAPGANDLNITLVTQP